MFPFGTIVLARFPFTDLSGDKRRPALVVSRDGMSRSDVIVCFITSVRQSGPDISPVDADGATGLKVPSWVCLGKVATLRDTVITGKLGNVTKLWLAANGSRFFNVFGFGPSDV